MINLIIDQNNKNALTMPDGFLRQFAKDVINEHADKGDVTYTIGNEQMLLFFRIAIKDGLLDTEQLNATCLGQKIEISNKGKYKSLPESLVNVWEDALMELL